MAIGDPHFETAVKLAESAIPGVKYCSSARTRCDHCVFTPECGYLVRTGYFEPASPKDAQQESKDKPQTLVDRLGYYIAALTAVRGGVDPVLHEVYEALSRPKPVDALLFCPACGTKHVDKPEPEKGWDNPPHKSHLCHKCGTIWRAADVPTNGVEYPQTRGEHDTYRDAPPLSTAAES